MPLAVVDRLGEPVVLLDPVGSPGRLVELDEHGALAWDALAWRRRGSGVGLRASGGPRPESRRATGHRRLLARWRAGDCLLEATGNSRFGTTCGCRQRYGERNGETHRRDFTRLGRCALHLSAEAIDQLDCVEEEECADADQLPLRALGRRGRR